MKPRAANAAAGLVALGVVLAACGGGDGDGRAAAGSTSSTIADPGPPYPVVTLEKTYVDPTRPVEDPAGNESAPQRRLETSVWMPDDEGPFPLIVFAHGHTGHPRKVTELLGAWAAAGYVVAAPAFPLTNDDVEPTSIPDLVEQPADVSVVIDRVLDDAASATGPLAGRVDADRIGVVGHSLGGSSMYAVFGNTCCLDDRIRAGMGFSALKPNFEGEYVDDPDRPLLLVHGDADTSISYDLSVKGLGEWSGPAWLLTLLGGTHSPPYEDSESPHDDLVIEATVLFWDAFLRDDEEARAAFEAFEPPPELARITPG